MDMLTAGFRAANVSWKWTEMMVASAYVLHRRSAVLLGAASNPMTADLDEIGRMIPEKADAFYKAMTGAGRARDPMEAMESFIDPIHARATGNAKRLRQRA